MACMHVREWPKTGPASRFTQCLLPVSFCRHVRCHLDVPRQSGGCHSETTCSMLPEAPVASREATSLPGHLTCLPGRAAWGVWSPAPQVQDPLLACWTGSGTRILVLTGPDRVLLLEYQPGLVSYAAAQCPRSHAQLYVMHHAPLRHTLRQS